MPEFITVQAVCLRSENAKVTVDSTYALSPHFLVFVGDDGEVALNFTQTRRILDVVKKLALGRSQPDTQPSAPTFC